MSELKLTNTERIIMEVLWTHEKEYEKQLCGSDILAESKCNSQQRVQAGGMSNADIFMIIGAKYEWSRHMVKIYTKGLADKGLLGINKISERKIKFYPIVSKEEYLASAANGFLRKNYSGLSNMIAGLINNEKVSKDEIIELEKLIQTFKEND